jgi:DNA-binding NtrC family response regulator
VIDDHEPFLDIISEMLIRLGYDAETTCDCFKGLKLLRSETYHLVIVDMTMPEIGGLVLIEAIRQEYPHVPVLAVSGFYDKIAKIVSQQAIGGFLRKPVKLKTLKTVLDSILWHNRAERPSNFQMPSPSLP